MSRSTAEAPLWLSVSLLTLSYFTYGWFLHHVSVGLMVWLLSGGFALALSSLLTIAWDSCRQFVLRRIQSDVGYTLAILSLASLAVALIAWIHIFAYFIVMIAGALFVRLDTVVRGFSRRRAFLLLLTIALFGLGSSWIATRIVAIAFA